MAESSAAHTPMELWRDGAMTEDGVRLMAAISLAALLSSYGFSKKSLDKFGTIAAFFTGVISFFSSLRFGMILIAFFLSSSRLTKVNARKKSLLEADHKEGGQRTWVQVLSNSVSATIIAWSHFWYLGDPSPLDQRRFLSTFFQCAFVSHFACCNGDTWASELGILDSNQPFLITTFRKVPTGTNGAISFSGTLASLAGGAFIGLTYYFCPYTESMLKRPYPPQWPVIFLGAACGIGGSMVDSLLGATLQFSGFSKERQKVVNSPHRASPQDEVRHISGLDVLDNHQVNFLSSLVTALVGGYAGVYLF